MQPAVAAASMWQARGTATCQTQARTARAGQEGDEKGRAFAEPTGRIEAFLIPNLLVMKSFRGKFENGI